MSIKEHTPWPSPSPQTGSTTAPRVSIGMPLYNEEKYLRTALDSLLAQDFPNFELIISDNASEDATQQICLEYATRDPRVRYYRNDTNLGSIENFNRVFRLSRGEYFMWAAGHDLWAPAFISRCLAVLEKDPSVVLCSTRTQFIHADGRQLTVVDLNRDTRSSTLLGRFILTVWDDGSCFDFYGLIRSNSLRHTRLLRRVFGPDRLLLAELSILGPFAKVPDPLFSGRDQRGERAGPNKNKSTKPYLERLFPGKKNRLLQFFPYAGFTYELLLAVIHAPVAFKAKIPLTTFLVLAWLVKSLPLILRRPIRGFLHRLLRIISLPSTRAKLPTTPDKETTP